MIVVSGANGTFGRLVVEHLLRQVPGERVVASVRSVAAAGSLAERGVVVRHGDFDAPHTLPAAFAGAQAVLVNGTNYGTAPDRRAAQQAAAIAAARAAGATRVVVTSWQDLDRCPLEIASDFPATERLAGDTGIVLRMTYSMAGALARDVRSAPAAGVLLAPAGTARATPAAVADLAEAAALVLAGAGHEGKTYELSGPDAISWADLATLAGDGIAYRPVSAAEFGTHVAGLGFPAAMLDGLLALYAAFRAGWANTPSTDLAELLGRAPTPSLTAVAQAVQGG
jgi:NAD(P)H dehydrogenase (quinone)